MQGIITQIVATQGTGFIQCEAGRVFFHQADLRGGLAFSGKLENTRVQFDLTQNHQGNKAKYVRPVKV